MCGWQDLKSLRLSMRKTITKTFSHPAASEESTEDSKMLIQLLGKVSQLRVGSQPKYGGF